MKAYEKHFVLWYNQLSRELWPSLSQHRPVVFWRQDFWVLLWWVFFLLVFHVGNKKKCQTSLLFFIVASWWSGLMAGRQTEGQPLIYFLKSPFHKNQWLLFSFFTDFSGDDLHLIQGYRGVSSLPGLWVSRLCNLPAWTVLASSGHSRGVSGMKEGRNPHSGHPKPVSPEGAQISLVQSRERFGAFLASCFITKSKNFDNGGVSATPRLIVFSAHCQ